MPRKTNIRTKQIRDEELKQAIEELIQPGDTDKEFGDILFVSKSGSDTNSGRSMNNSLLTINRAIELSKSGDAIHVIGGGIYDEDLFFASNTWLYAPNSVLRGTITIANCSVIQLNWHLARNIGDILVRNIGCTGRSFYKANVITGRAGSAMLTDTTLFRNEVKEAILTIDVGIAYVAVNGKGIATAESGGIGLFNVSLDEGRWFSSTSTRRLVGYGALYNSYILDSIVNVDYPGQDEWRVPSKEDVEELEAYVGEDAGIKLKCTRTVGYNDVGTSDHPRWDFHSDYRGQNLFRFKAYPSGYRSDDGIFKGLGQEFVMLTSSMSDEVSNLALEPANFYTTDLLSGDPSHLVEGNLTETAEWSTLNNAADTAVNFTASRTDSGSAQNLAEGEDGVWQANDGGTTNLWVQYDIGAGETAEIISYDIFVIEGNRASIAWTLRGSNDGFTSEDIILDTVSGLSWTNNERKTFNVDNPGEYRYYRFVFTQTPHSQRTQLVEIRLFEDVSEEMSVWYNFGSNTLADILTIKHIDDSLKPERFELYGTAEGESEELVYTQDTDIEWIQDNGIYYFTLSFENTKEYEIYRIVWTQFTDDTKISVSEIQLGTSEHYIVKTLRYDSNEFAEASELATRNHGYAIRLMRPTTSEEDDLDDGYLDTMYYGRDGEGYRITKIGNQVWMGENLAETIDDRGEITEIVDNGDWSSDNIGALCYYNNQFFNSFYLPGGRSESLSATRPLSEFVQGRMVSGLERDWIFGGHYFPEGATIHQASLTCLHETRTPRVYSVYGTKDEDFYDVETPSGGTPVYSDDFNRGMTFYADQDFSLEYITVDAESSGVIHLELWRYLSEGTTSGDYFEGDRPIDGVLLKEWEFSVENGQVSLPLKYMGGEGGRQYYLGVKSASRCGDGLLVKPDITFPVADEGDGNIVFVDARSKEDNFNHGNNWLFFNEIGFAEWTTLTTEQLKFNWTSQEEIIEIPEDNRDDFNHYRIVVKESNDEDDGYVRINRMAFYALLDAPIGGKMTFNINEMNLASNSIGISAKSGDCDYQGTIKRVIAEPGINPIAFESEHDDAVIIVEGLSALLNDGSIVSGAHSGNIVKYFLLEEEAPPV